MILSQNEKRALLRRQKEMDEYEDEMVRRYAQEQLRNDLYVQESEEAAQAKERAEAEKRVRVREELQAAREYQLRLKAERAEEEKRMEEEFKRKLMEKFAEDDRLE